MKAEAKWKTIMISHTVLCSGNVPDERVWCWYEILTPYYRARINEHRSLPGVSLEAEIISLKEMCQGRLFFGTDYSSCGLEVPLSGKLIQWREQGKIVHPFAKNGNSIYSFVRYNNITLEDSSGKVSGENSWQI